MWSKNLKDSFQYILAIVICIAFFWLVIVLVRKEIPQENSALLNITVGALIGSFTTIVSYYFGSSRSSASKDDIIKELKDTNIPK